MIVRYEDVHRLNKVLDSHSQICVSGHEDIGHPPEMYRNMLSQFEVHKG